MDDKEADDFFEVLAGRKVVGDRVGLAKGGQIIRDCVLDARLEREEASQNTMAGETEQASLQKLLSRLESSDATKTPPGASTLPPRVASRRGGGFRAFLGLLTFYPAAASTMAALLLALGLGIGIAMVDLQSVDQPRGAEVLTLEVTFRDVATVKEIRDTILNVRGTIVAGPSKRGAFKIAFEEEAELEEAFDMLQKLKERGQVVEEIGRAAARAK